VKVRVRARGANGAIGKLRDFERGDRWGQDRYPDHEEWWAQLRDREVSP